MYYDSKNDYTAYPHQKHNPTSNRTNNHNYIANDGSSKTVTLELTAEEKVAGAHAYLNSTDWYVVRKADTGKAIPEDVTTKRIEARQTINDLEE